ncbi:DedA family protein [Actinoplanes couchii]|uniref:VTT domain-containing protein n=1 Tax=Actinoplanes couchii TaxID=403638 RepID=A0ABQ3WZX8_9ACTN|nr:VTT domain-containing protein [Actinoplanes couchii]MDR6316215.1 membrane protein DedA with SNARE-associated domain [Actinoplanes couchii]GID51829.1 hypothetical protein Aco03nite_002330 [Actinoplanes couchii]
MPNVDLPTATGWVLVLVFVMVVLDALLPFMPGETVLLAAGVAVAHHGSPGLALLLVTVAATAVLGGDLVAYRIGGLALTRRLRRGRRGAAWLARLTVVMGTHGPLLLMFGRHLPGVRSATAYLAGTLGFPIRRFVTFTLAGAILWAAQAVLIGYLGGVVFPGDPLAALVSAWLVALLAGALFLSLRRIRV